MNRTDCLDEGDGRPAQAPEVPAVRAVESRSGNGQKTRLRLHPFRAFRADLDRYLPEGAGWEPTLRCLLLRTELHAIFLFRIGTWVYRECPAPVSMFLRVFWRPWQLLVQTLTDIHLPPGTDIGPGLCISHRGGIWINVKSRIGSNCTLTPGVIIGAAGGASERKVFPVIGDRVWIGPHAVITGSARVGNDCVISANSLVVGRVPDKATVVGVPATILNRWGSERLLGRISTRI
jgi:serine O-acetyltransferase